MSNSTYHCDADGVVKLVHENADDGRRQQQEDEGVFELVNNTKHSQRPPPSLRGEWSRSDLLLINSQSERMFFTNPASLVPTTEPE